MLKLNRRSTCLSGQASPRAMANTGVGGPEMEMRCPPGLRIWTDLCSSPLPRLFSTTS
ncbi:hypothetical protein D3C80_2053730 [compost metagenome]